MNPRMLLRVVTALMLVTAVVQARVKLVALPERVRISYRLQGLGRDIVYKAVAEPDETALTLRNYLRLRNDSGEDLTEAEISVGYGADFKKTVAHEEILEMLSERIELLPIKKV